MARNLGELQASQLLMPPETSAGVSEVNPAIRDVLRELFEREDPRAYRQAHHRAAEHYLGQDSSESLATIEHLVQAGDLDQALALLEHRMEQLYDGDNRLTASRWLCCLEAHFATLPQWACYYLGRHYTARGQWDQARRYLEHCKSALKERAAAGDLWRWQPRVCFGFATMYWRRGMSDEARTYCRRGLDFVRQQRRKGAIPTEHVAESRRVQLELLNLLGTLKLERGIYDKVDEVASEAVAMAREVQRPRAEATALRQLGVVASHRGDFDGARAAFEQALTALDPQRHPCHHALATFELGRLERRTGSLVEGRSLIEEASRRVLHTGHPATVARLLAVLGEVCSEDGDTARAAVAFTQAREIAEAVTDTKVKAEVLDRQAIFLATSGQLDEARRVLAQASDLVAGQLKTQLHLNARHYEARAECAAAGAEHTKAVQHFRHAVERSQRIGALYHVARLGWRGARHGHRAFMTGDEATPESVFLFVDAAALAMSEGGVGLGNCASFEVLHVGAAFAPEPARSACH
ncbi:MAG: tetratricopeptide repeat protein, partial [Myxococcota bacterium]|nr:tetratricopeptide repeat protein [Myxococcota bacterium]